jgi:hypothetical protein
LLGQTLVDIYLDLRMVLRQESEAVWPKGIPDGSLRALVSGSHRWNGLFGPGFAKQTRDFEAFRNIRIQSLELSILSFGISEKK